MYAGSKAFFYALSPSAHGFTEDRYARMLKRVVYQHKGRHRGYGLKFWPRETTRMIDAEERFNWFREEYPT